LFQSGQATGAEKGFHIGPDIHVHGHDAALDLGGLTTQHRTKNKEGDKNSQSQALLTIPPFVFESR
jgi:hypothetical protein